MNIQMSYLVKTLVTVSILGLSFSSHGDDETISAVGSCRDSLGTTISSGGGIKASGGTAVVVCPLTKNTVNEAITNVYARMKRISSTGADPFCYLSTINNYGTPSQLGYGFASATTANQSVSLNIPTQYRFGYADVYCVLNEGDTLFGIRYLQND